MKSNNSKGLFVHIGLQKTGTTYLQEFFYPVHPEICYLGKRNPIHEREQSIRDRFLAGLLPTHRYTRTQGRASRFNSVNERVQLVTELQSPGWISEIYTKPRFWNPDNSRKGLDEAAKDCERNLILFSDEGLAGDPIWRPYALDQSAHRLKELIPAAHILIVLRNQLSMLDSVYRMYVGSGGYSKFSSMLNYEEDCQASKAKFLYAYVRI